MVRHNNNDDDLTPEQRAAAKKFTADLRTAMPTVRGIGRVAQQVYADFIAAPTWHLADAPKSPDFTEPPPQQWTVGHAKVNYVDHIKTALDDDEDDQ